MSAQTGTEQSVAAFGEQPLNNVVEETHTITHHQLLLNTRARNHLLPAPHQALCSGTYDHTFTFQPATHLQFAHALNRVRGLSALHANS